MSYTCYAGTVARLHCLIMHALFGNITSLCVVPYLVDERTNGGLVSNGSCVILNL